MSRSVADQIHDDSKFRARRLSKGDASDDHQEHHTVAHRPRKMSNPDTSNDLRHLSLTNHTATPRERFNTQPGNQLDKHHKARRSPVDNETHHAEDGPPSSPLRPDSGLPYHFHATQPHSLTTTLASMQKQVYHIPNTSDGTHFRERSHTMPSSSIAIPVAAKHRVDHQQQQKLRGGDTGLDSPRRGSKDDLHEHAHHAVVGNHSSKPAFGRTQLHPAGIKLATVKLGDEKPQSAAANRSQAFSDNGVTMTADDLLDTYIQRATVIRHSDRLPSGSDIFEELRSELRMENSVSSVETSEASEKTAEDELNSTKTKASKMVFNQHLQNVKPSLRTSKDKDKIMRPNSCSAPNSPGLARRVHFH